jgi:hypothetical protein
MCASWLPVPEYCDECVELSMAIVRRRIHHSTFAALVNIASSPKITCALPKQQVFRPAMTLGNMRENGVRSLSVTCELCHHEALMNVDTFGDVIPIPAFGPRMFASIPPLLQRKNRSAFEGRPDRKYSL